MTCVAGLSLTLLTTTAASAEPNGGIVNGAIELPPLKDRAPRPMKSQGFSRRIKGPLLEPRRADPRPRIVVVLVGGPVAKEDAEPSKRPARYALIGESFKSEVFPFVVGSPVEIKNDGHNSPLLYAVGNDDAIESGSVSPGGVRKVKAPSKPLASLKIRDRESPHLSGAIVAMPHSYFSLIAPNGSYSIKGVPAGKWTVKLWHDGGWLELPKTVTVNVVGKRPVKASSIRLPVELKSAPTAESN